MRSHWLRSVEKSTIRMVFVLLICSILTSSFPIVAGYECGIHSGDWIKYNITVSYGGQSLTGSIKITIQNVQGTKINGTIEMSVQGYSVTQPEPISFDIATGTGAYVGFILPANLTIGDYIPGENAYVESVVTKNGRNAIQANASSPFGGFSGQVYWDQATGVLLETSGQAVGTSYSIGVAETSLWGGGFLFDWWLWVIIIVVVGVAPATAVVMLRRRKPAAKQPPVEIPPPPPPPPPSV
jgi:hypothetical protein